MHRTLTSFRTDPTTRLTELGQQRPEWRVWLGMLGEVLPLLHEPGGASFLSAASDGSPDRTAAHPLLHGRELVINAPQVRDLLYRLVEISAADRESGSPALRGYRPSADSLLFLLAASIRGDRVGLREHATTAGVDPGVLEILAQLAALPLLQACGRLLRNQFPAAWPHGYCPVCGSWPLLGEFRSLDRTRRLRCGRCAADWRINWLRCPYCGETDHERLGSLVPEDKLQPVTVETCLECHGYVKTVTTLQAIPPFELLLWDLETVELDMTALDRGYARPGGAGFSVDVQIRLQTRAMRPFKAQ